MCSHRIVSHRKTPSRMNWFVARKEGAMREGCKLIRLPLSTTESEPKGKKKNNKKIERMKTMDKKFLAYL